MGRPEVLYHGSCVLVDILEPINGFLYAAHAREVAIPFALAVRPDDQGRSNWNLHMHSEHPRVEIVRGWLDTTGIGYLYHLAPDAFEDRRWQWVTRDAVTPLRHEIIRAADYVSWIAKGEVR